MNRRSFMKPTRHHPWLLLWLVPYLFLSAFGEAFHQHPLYQEESAHTSLVGASAFLPAAAYQTASETVPHTHRASGLECLICSWSTQSAAHFATPQLYLPSSSTLARTAAVEAAHQSLSPLALRTRGPPLSSVV
ncbi:MAG: hypothetical protein JWN98_1780 [Abditibacteriota bacterium]|nr:hypothetical protein [Abditibacteriota bacterium]